MNAYSSIGKVNCKANHFSLKKIVTSSLCVQNLDMSKNIVEDDKIS